MKVIFLDIDGVVNQGYKPLKGGFDYATPECVAQLNRIIEETGAHIVISSSWRIGATLEELSKHFTKVFGIKGNFTSMTPVLYEEYEGTSVAVPRAKEIYSWLDSRFGIESFVVLDDNKIFENENYGNKFFHKAIARRLVRTRTSLGLTAKDADKAIKILNG